MYGVAESEKKDVRARVSEICQDLLPEHKTKFAETIDTVHRLGRKRPPDSKPRGIIIQFSTGLCRDAIWKEVKVAHTLRVNGLKFAEDLSKEDRECRNRLWPLVEKARRECKAVHFVGGRAFINGSEINPPS
ncbi:hypothetical protein XENOCAPTIV_027483 [Xenoophorus captivus]|uniref:Uncharacterized protein n=1 Tax=Xenoophorus captivus TaxID=1517983 RepID=A0ABV0RAK8_9TELE